MSKTTKLLIAGAFVALIGFIIYSTMGLAKVNCQVCMEFHGKVSCKPAFGTTEAEAMQTARTIACSDIAFGREESVVCQASQPKSTNCKQE